MYGIADGAEGGANGVFRFTRSGSTAASLTVNYAVITTGPGMATPGNDYGTLSGMVTIPAGSSYWDVTVGVVNDPTAEPTEEVRVSLTSAAQYTLDPYATASVFIADNDTASGTIAGVVWADTDGDGVREAGEPLRAGETVTLLDQNGAPLFDTVTDAAGAYSFPGLAAGSYAVDFDPSLSEKSSPKDNTTDDKDSDADPATGQAVVTLTAQQMTSLLVGAGFTLMTAPPTPTGPTVVFTDNKGNVLPANGALRVAKWHDAFEIDPDVPLIQPAGVATPRLRGPDAAKLDFIDRDDDRFNVRVYDRAKWDDANVTTLDVTIETKGSAAAYNDDATKIGVVKMKAGLGWDGWFWSDSQMLVSNTVDDGYHDRNVGDDNQPPGAGVNEKAQHKFPVSDRTHIVALGGTVEAKYGTLTAQATVPVQKTVKLNVTVLSESGVTPATVTAHITKMQEIYAQIGIKVDSQVQGKNSPAGVNLGSGNGLDEFTQDRTGRIVMTAEERALLDAPFRTPTDAQGKDDIEVYYVNTLSRGSFGESFPLDLVPDPKYAHTVILAANSGGDLTPDDTLAHEATHVLLNLSGHQGGEVAPSAVDRTNLLVSGKFSVEKGKVIDSRRLTAAQDATIKVRVPSLIR